MSVERHGHIVWFQCDCCPDAIDTEETEFHPALAKAKDAGWRAVKADDGQWRHMCPDCVEGDR